MHGKKKLPTPQATTTDFVQHPALQPHSPTGARQRKMTLMVSSAAEKHIPEPHGEEKRGWRGEEGTVPAPATCSISQEQAGPAAQSCRAGLSTQLLKAITAKAKWGAWGAALVLAELQQQHRCRGCSAEREQPFK